MAILAVIGVLAMLVGAIDRAEAATRGATPNNEKHPELRSG